MAEPVITGLDENVRGRFGDEVEIDGTGFSTTIAFNIVSIGGVLATVTIATATKLTARLLTAGVPEDQWVSLAVQNIEDTVNNPPFAQRQYFAKIAKADLPLSEPPGQVPSSQENVDTEAPQAGEAKDYERLVTFAQFLLREILTTKGDLFVRRDGGGLQRLPVGADDLLLTASDPGVGGFVYAKQVRAFSLYWGKLILTTGSNNGAMVANGDSTVTGTGSGEHVAATDAHLAVISVLVQDVSGAQDLDQVQVDVNGGNVYDSGTGLGLTAGQSHIAFVNLSVDGGDRIELIANGDGATGEIELSGTIVLYEGIFVALSDTIAVTDGVVIENLFVAVSDAIAVSDQVELGGDVALVLPTDAVVMTDAVAVSLEIGVVLSDNVAVADQVELGGDVSLSLADSVAMTDSVSREAF